MIAVVDYGLGNVHAFINIYKRLDIPMIAAQTPDDLVKGQKIILPGVGAFDWAMTRLNDSGMRDCLDELVLQQRRPVLGICVGMQIMARRSDEGHLPGLAWFDAEVKKFDKNMFALETPLPHMGWNDVKLEKPSSLFQGIENDPRFYFLHSFFFHPSLADDVMTSTNYNGYSFVSSSHSRNIFGVQFHPEKSHQWGIRLLKNFAEY